MKDKLKAFFKKVIVKCKRMIGHIFMFPYPFFKKLNDKGKKLIKAK